MQIDETLWAAFQDVGAQPDGLLYSSRLFPRCFHAAVFDRSSTDWQEELLGDLLSIPDANGNPVVFQVLEGQGWGLVG